jgi:hypothetical protein
MPIVRLTARGARVLRQGKELLQSLRAIANDTEYEQTDEPDRMRLMHREAIAMIEVVLRTVQAMPASVSGQLRICDGLEVVITEVRQRVDGLHHALTQRRRTAARIEELADQLRRLAGQLPVNLAPLQAMADAIRAATINSIVRHNDGFDRNGKKEPYGASKVPPCCTTRYNMDAIRCNMDC